MELRFFGKIYDIIVHLSFQNGCKRTENFKEKITK